MSLWSFHKNAFKTLPEHASTKVIKPSKEASLCTFTKASYTVEAAVIIPLIAGFLATILFFFRILQVQEAVENALYYAGRKTAVESSVIDSKEALFLSSEVFFRYALSESEVVTEYVEGGSLGISLLSSRILDDEICLHAEYRMQLPIAFFEIGKLQLGQMMRFRRWTGDEVQTNENTVYITETGDVYHKTLECQSIKLSIQKAIGIKIPFLRGKNGQKYDACSRCVTVFKFYNHYYYTDYGTLYHSNMDCSAIKRTVMAIDISEIGNRTPCSFCYE